MIADTATCSKVTGALCAATRRSGQIVDANVSDPPLGSNGPGGTARPGDAGMSGADQVRGHCPRNRCGVREVLWKRLAFSRLLSPHRSESPPCDLAGQRHSRELAAFRWERDEPNRCHCVAPAGGRFVEREPDAHDQLLTSGQIESHLPPGRTATAVASVVGAHAPGSRPALDLGGELRRDSEGLARSACLPQRRDRDEPLLGHPAREVASSMSVRTP